MLYGPNTRLPSRPLIIRVHFFLLISFSKETPKYKGKRGTTGVLRIAGVQACAEYRG